MNNLIQDRNSNFPWQAQGPSPAQNGQVESITPNNEVVGAIHTVLAHPSDANTLWIGAVNGGIWRTTNATATSPNWTALTDEFRGLSMGAMEFDPTDTDPEADGPTIIAGIGRFSAHEGKGGPLTGLLLSTDGGDNFTQITGDPNPTEEDSLIGRNISGVAIRGETILATANNFSGGAGVYRSTDQGGSWEFISGDNGLASGAAFDLVADPTDNQQFYVSVQSVGIFHSDDAGETWNNISSGDTNLDAAITATGNNNTEMAVASDGRLYVAVLANNQPSYIGFTDNPTAVTSAWTQMDLPLTPEPVGGNPINVGLNPTPKPGGQGAIHFSIIADPNNPNIVYVGGDRQGAPGGQATTFPTFVGANAFSGRLFRGDTTVNPTNGSPSPQWEHLTHSNSIAAIPNGGTASNSAPHADSREMTFDANGNIIEVDDGGIYRRTSPQDNTGDWFSINGNLQVTEIHDIAYDPISNIIISGNQDTGTTQQISSGSMTWNSVSLADGGDVAVSVDPNDPDPSNPSQSVRYSSTQNLGFPVPTDLVRRVYDASNSLVSSTTVGLNGFMATDAQFITHVVVNEVNPNRIAIGGRTRVYESFNQGDNVIAVNTAGGGSVGVNSENGNSVNTDDGDPIVYGGRRNGINNADLLYVGSGSQVFRRTVATSFGGTLEDTNYPGGRVRDIALDREDWMSAFAIDDDQVFRTVDANTDNIDNDGNGEIDEADEIDWHEITGNLVEDFRDGLDLDLRSIEFIDIPHLDDAVAVGTNRGVFASLSLTDFTDWFQVGVDLPNAPVWDMDYDPTNDVLVVGTLGRGAWSFPDARESITTIVSSSNPTPENDILIGTPDPDNIDALAGDDFVKGLESNDTLMGQDGDDTLKGGEGNDILNGGEDDDLLQGNSGNDTLDGGDDDDILQGGEGDDILDGGDGDDQLSGGAGNDLLDGGEDSDQVSGGPGNTLSGEDGDDTLKGGDNSDTLDGGNGNDILMGEDGDDVMDAGPGNDYLDGGEDEDEMLGRDGDDTLKGGDNSDTLDGGNGNDILNGENDDDLIKGGAGDDLLNGGESRDELFGEEDNDTLNGGKNNDLLDGGQGNDILNGGEDDDVIAGGAGDDVLNGGADRDELSGGDGDDLLDGGEGEDELLGGGGADTFQLSSDEEADIILDYQDGLDVLGITNLAFGDLTITQDDSQTSISITATDEVLATLIDVSANVIDAGDFEITLSP